MLILDRKLGQQVVIGDGLIRVKAMKMNEEYISIAFFALSHINIDREEVYIKKLAQLNSSLGAE